MTDSLTDYFECYRPRFETHLQQIFADNRLPLQSNPRLQPLLDALAHLTEHPEVAEAIARNGRKAACALLQRENHTDYWLRLLRARRMGGGGQRGGGRTLDSFE